MKLKDVNTTDLYATDNSELARVVMIGQLWKRDSFDRSDFPFKRASSHARQGRIGEGWSGTMVGHLMIVHHGQMSENTLQELTDLRLPPVNADMSDEEQLVMLRALSARLEGTDFRLLTVNTQRVRPWAEHAEAKRKEYEAWERSYNEDEARRAWARDRFNPLRPALSVYGLQDNDLNLMMSQVIVKAHNREPLSVTVPLDVLKALLADAARGREARGR
jgi:hypothetical protein